MSSIVNQTLTPTTDTSTSTIDVSEKPFIPIIDFSGFYNGNADDKQRIGVEIDHAARTSGFLVIKGHGMYSSIVIVYKYSIYN